MSMLFLSVKMFIKTVNINTSISSKTLNFEITKNCNSYPIVVKFLKLKNELLDYINV